MNFTFVVTEEEANIVLTALIDQPYKYVAGVVEKLNKQALEQRNTALAESKSEKEKGK